MSALEVLEPGEQTLSELAATANREHGLAVEAGASMVEHAIRAGHALLRAQADCPKGNWRVWLRENWDASIPVAGVYMRLAEHEDAVRVSDIASINGARKHLALLGATRGNPALSRGWRKDAPRWVTDELRELRASGLSWAEISHRAGVPASTAQYWLDPRQADMRRERQRQRHAALVKEQRAQTERRAVRKAGAAMQEAWAMAERMQDVIAQAHRETEDREARRALSEAGVHYRKMRDEIVRALGVS